MKKEKKNKNKNRNNWPHLPFQILFRLVGFLTPFLFLELISLEQYISNHQRINLETHTHTPTFVYTNRQAKTQAKIIVYTNHYHYVLQ